MLAQDNPKIEHCERQPAHRWWLSETSQLADMTSIASIQCALAFVEVYDKIEIP